MKTTLKFALASALTVFMASMAMATEMDLKVSDSTTIGIDVEVPKYVSMTKPDDMSLRFDGKDNIIESSNFCVASNVKQPVSMTIKGVTGTYKNKSDFSLISNEAGSTNTVDGHNEIPVAVRYVPATGGDQPIQSPKASTLSIEPGTPFEVHGTQWLSTCEADSKKGSAIQVEIDKNHAQDVFAGFYSTTLTLEVSPE